MSLSLLFILFIGALWTFLGQILYFPHLFYNGMLLTCPILWFSDQMIASF